MSVSPDPNQDHQWSDRNAPPEAKELITLAGMFLCGIIVLIWLFNLAISWAIVQMPVSWERQLGQAIVHIYEQQALESPQQDKLNELVDQLEAKISTGSTGDRDYQVLYIPSDVVNAGAIPGDTILVYQGLLDQMASENELMMVLGHEIGHFANRDHLRSIGKALVIRTVVSSLFGDVTFLADAAQIISRTRFSQAQEIEADQYGLELLFQTYGQVAGATDFFTRLSENIGANWDFLATHPAPAKRVVLLNKLIATKDYPLGEYTPLPEILIAS